MVTFVKYSFPHTVGHEVYLYDTPADAVEEAELEDGEACSVYLFIDDDGGRYWGVRKGHDGWGVHTTAAKARSASDWFADQWCFTTNIDFGASLLGLCRC